MKESLKKFLEVLILDCYDCNMATQRHCNKRCNWWYKNESVAIEKFDALRDVKPEKYGLFIRQEHTQLVTSPDKSVDENIVLEAKCPHVHRDKAIWPQTVPHLRYNDSSMILYPKHNYFYQKQDLLFCTERKLYLFMVCTLEDLLVTKTEKDDKFIEINYKNFLCFTIHILN